jgi:hypothetical protein
MDYQVFLHLFNKSNVISGTVKLRLTASVSPVPLFPCLIFYILLFCSQAAGINMFFGCKKTSDPTSVN